MTTFDAAAPSAAGYDLDPPAATLPARLLSGASVGATLRLSGKTTAGDPITVEFTVAGVDANEHRVMLAGTIPALDPLGNVWTLHIGVPLAPTDEVGLCSEAEPLGPEG